MARPPSSLTQQVLFTGFISASMLVAAPAGQVVTFGNFIHNVASLEKSAAFYQDALGLELTGPLPISQRVFGLCLESAGGEALRNAGFGDARLHGAAS